MFGKVKKADGFTLLELLVVMGILGILTSTSMVYFFDMMASSRDTVAISDANSLMTVVYENIIYNRSVNYQAQNGQQVGVADAVGVARDPVYTLSAGVEIDFAGGFNNMSYGEDDATPSQFNANLYHSSGTPGRTVQIIVDELNEVQDFIVW